MGWVYQTTLEAALFSPQTCNKSIIANSRYGLHTKVLCSQITSGKQTMCQCILEAAVFSPQTCNKNKYMIPTPDMDKIQKCRALKLLPLDKQLLCNKCVLMQNVVHGKAPQYLKDLMIPFESLHVHGNKQLLPWERIETFKTNLSFSGSVAWNSLPLRLRY